MRRVIENPRTGERIVIHQSGCDSHGELLVFDVFLQPGGHVPAGHVHPEQQEHFRVISGRVRFRVGGRSLELTSDETVSVPRGTPHWFGNAGPDRAHLRVEVRPALRMQELLEASGEPSGLLDWALIPLDFQRELRVPHVPAWLITTLLTPLAWLRLRVRTT
jgi:mannose-6-phosphate isomerase-like protein (cupin superfamily)